MSKFHVTICVLALAVATATVRADLVPTADGVAVHDTVSGTYWLRDLSTFDHLSYTDQIAAIEAFGDGNWRMALLEDMDSMAGNSDASIHDAFLPTAQSTVEGVDVDIYFGRVDFEFGPGIHMIAHMSWNTTDDEVFSPLLYLGNGGSDEGPGPDGQGGFAAWVVHIGPYVPDGETCTADVNGDDTVNVLDLIQLILQWGGPGSADFNDDGVVDVLDLSFLVVNWGDCSP